MTRPPRPEKSDPRIWRYELPGGWIVLAGKNDQDNDQLSLKIAEGMLRPRPPSIDVLQFAHGPLQTLL